ncbi:GNAT family N-acetyltransferase [Clostridium hydrogenum]|uniref:GNAT family N-acetyltransferase n=1 Tax=Clostridium hydrogenum TaxID=2855764 RepID=UPI001F1B35EA|nr:GNAT family N-acetyltransferase [Clostridium hydrogenum]
MKYIIETDRLRFRRFELSDAEELYKHHQEAELMKWIPNESYQDIAEAEGAIKFYADCVNKNQLPFVLAIELKENDKLIGDTGINEIEGKQGEVEIGYCICEGYQGNGLATEALKAVTDFISSHFEVKTLYGRIMHGNEASVKVMEKCGYNYINEEFGAEDDPYGKGMLIYRLA